MATPEDPDFEDSYFADCEIEIDGLLITPENTIVHLFQPYCFSFLEVDVGDDATADVIVDEDVIKLMILNGFHFREHGPASEGLRTWYEFTVAKTLEFDIAEWQRNNP